MVAGVIFFALGLKKTLGEPDDALKIVPDVALLGGVALYLLAPSSPSATATSTRSTGGASPWRSSWSR